MSYSNDDLSWTGKWTGTNSIQNNQYFIEFIDFHPKNTLINEFFSLQNIRGS